MNLELSLFNLFPVKDVTVNVIPKTTVIPIGKAIGMKLYTDGVLIVGMTEIEGKKPYENTGIEAGDKIIEIDNTEINNTNDLIACVNASKGKTTKTPKRWLLCWKTLTTSKQCICVPVRCLT